MLFKHWLNAIGSITLKLLKKPVVTYLWKGDGKKRILSGWRKYKMKVFQVICLHVLPTNGHKPLLPTV